MKRLACGLALVAALTSCSFFGVNKAGSGLGGLSIQIAPLGSRQGNLAAKGARTILPGIVAAADTYTITLSNNSAYPSLIHSLSFGADGVSKGQSNNPIPGPTCMMANIELGTWDVNVDALKGTTLLGRGGLASQTVTTSGGYGTPIQVSIEPIDPTLSGGSGSISLPISVFFMAPMSADFRLLKSNGVTVVDSRSNQGFTYNGDGTNEFTYTASGILAGSYFLEITLRIGGDIAGIYREAVDVWNGVTSNSWYNAAGNPNLYPMPGMTFMSGDLLDANSKLATCTVLDDQGNQILNLPSSLTDYDLGLVSTATITFVPQGSLLGSAQAISYQWDEGATVGIQGSAVSSPLQLRTGSNTLVLTVTSPDGKNTTQYRLAITCPAMITSGTGIKMIQVSGGSFNRDDVAGQTSTVSGFLIGSTDVTQAQYQAVMGVNPSTLYGIPAFVGPQLPVVMLSWFDAIAFCNKQSVMEGLDPAYSLASVITDGNGSISSAVVSFNPVGMGYRLPTEAEWEFAARGGTKSMGYSYAGSNNPETVAWYGFGAGYQGPAKGSTGILPVASLAPNELGLYDMSGNVYQWCWDASGTYPAVAVKDYLGTASSGGTVYWSGSVIARGGDYYYGAQACLVTARAGEDPYANRSEGMGFRVARNGPAGTSLSVTTTDASAFTVSGPTKLPSDAIATYSWTVKGGQGGGTYQWLVNGVVQSGATGSTFSLTRDSILAPPGTLFGKNRIAAIEQVGAGASATYSSSELSVEVDKPFTISGPASFVITYNTAESYSISGPNFDSYHWYVNGVEQTGAAGSATFVATAVGYAFPQGSGWLVSYPAPGALNQVLAVVTLTIGGTTYTFSNAIDVHAAANGGG